MRSRTGAVGAALAVLAHCACLVAFAGAAAAEDDAAKQLAERYAPIVVTPPKAEPCGKAGESFRPVPVDVVLGNPQVTLREKSGAEVKTAPTAADLYGLGDDYYLDFPGNSLKPRCDYERWFNQSAAGVPTTVYAHVVAEAGAPGRLALQYWFYWVFNDWNNTHESDWEMIQLVFPADTAAQALAVEPIEIGFAQHTGAEQADWVSKKLARDGTHPIVYPAPGSHASYYTRDLFLGYSAATGFGCDDTRDSVTQELATVIVLPDAASGPSDPLAWMDYRGKWGEPHAGPYGGPEGATAKSRWSEPMSWKDDAWRDSSLTVPASNSFAPTATGFFCTSVAAGSRFYAQFLHTPFLVLGFLVALVAGAVILGRRTRWSPAPALPIAMERHAGEIFRSSWRLYRRFAPLFVAMGIMFIPIGAVTALAQQLVFAITPLGSLVDVAFDDPGLRSVVALGFGAFGTILSASFVFAAVAEALDQIDDGGRPSVGAVYKTVFARLKPLAWAFVRVTVIVALLTLTIVGIPFAIVYLVRRGLATQAIMIERKDAREALGRSNGLVRGHTGRTFAVAAFVNTVAGLTGPFLGVLALLLWAPSLAAINLISAIVYAVVMPFAGAVMTLLFYDLRARQAGDRPEAVSTATVGAPG